MRKILFRGKRIDNGEWVEGDLFNKTKIVVTTTSNKGIYTEKGSDTFNYKYIEVIPETVGQFTGLTDKNGKEIFEGDVVIIDTISDKHRTVEFIQGCFKYVFQSTYISYYISHFFSYEVEVIGNIHDNP